MVNDLPETETVLLFVTVVPAALVGALLVSRRPRNLVGWLLVVTGSAFILQALAGNYALAGLAPERVPCPAASGRRGPACGFRGPG